MAAPAAPHDTSQDGARRFWRAPMLSSLPLRLSVIVICVLWTLPTAGLLVTSFRNPQLITKTGWWDAIFNMFATGPVDAPELPERPRRREHGERVPEQPDRDDPVDGHPDHDRGLRGLRLRVDPVPRPRDHVHDRRGAARRAAADGADPDPQDLQRRIAVRHVRRDLAGAHRVRAAARDLPALQLHEPAAARPLRVVRDRRRLGVPDVHPHRAAPVDPGAGRLRDLPVPVGLERPARGAGVPRARARTCRSCRRRCST